MTLEMPRGDKELLQGVCEMHVHCAPDIFKRPFNEIEFARNAQAVGYRAVLSKCHFTLNADRAQLVREIVPGIHFFGGIVLNHYVGGLNPNAVRAAIGYGAKQVWMPTLHAENHIRVIGAPIYPTKQWEKKADLGTPSGITILDSDGKVKHEVYEILDLIAAADIAVGTSHLSEKEVFALIQAARSSGVKKIIITHVGFKLTPWPIEDQIKMAEMGAIIEHSVANCIDVFERSIEAKDIAEAIKRVGADKCIMVTDLGQIANAHPIEGMRQFIYMMMAFGISRSEIDKMTKDNPAKLLGLE